MRKVLISVTMVFSLGLLGACGGSAEDVKEKDVYKVACPLLDASAGGNELSKKASRKAISELKKQDLDPQAEKFLELAELFVSEEDSKAGKEAKKQVKKLCKDKAGYKMQNM